MTSLCITHRVDEDISWVEDLYADLLIYNKGDDWNLPYPSYDAPKIKNEVDTYLRGIIQSYDLLHNYRCIFFLKPDCQQHYPDLISYLSIKQYNQIPDSQIVQLSDESYMFNYVEKIISCDDYERNLLINTKLIFSQLGININSGSYPCCTSNQFRVQTHFILCKSKDWWIECHKLAMNLYNQVGDNISKIFEVLWSHIFLHNKINILE